MREWLKLMLEEIRRREAEETRARRDSPDTAPEPAPRASGKTPPNEGKPAKPGGAG
jgi:hypothetical protein